MTQPDEDSHLEESETKAEELELKDDNSSCSCGTDPTMPEGTAKEATSTNSKKSYSQLKKKNSRKKRDKGRNKDEDQILSETEATPSLPAPKSSWLLRLFESKLCDMAIAIAYLYKSKESGVLAYLGNKLFVSMISLLFDC